MMWPGPGWAPPLTQRFLRHGRNWKAVEDFYRRLVAGQACLGDLGLAPEAQPWPEGVQPETSATQQRADSAAGSAPGQQPVPVVRTEASTDRAAQSAALKGQLPCNTVITGSSGHTDPPHDDEPAAKRRCTDRGRKATYKVSLSYYGPDFEGWAWAKERPNTVAGELDRALQAVNLKGQTRQVNICGAGRTDKGVSACGQVFSFATWDKPDPDTILQLINAIRPGSLRAWRGERMPNTFHATFEAEWRRYIYLLPLRSSLPVPTYSPDHMSSSAAAAQHNPCNTTSRQSIAASSACAAESQAEADLIAAGSIDAQQLRSDLKAAIVCPHTGLDLTAVDLLDVRLEDVNRLLAPLEGQTLDCTAFARDTPKGKDCRCSILRAHATEVMLPGIEGMADTPAICVELVANRFVRKTVRVLAATAFREAVPAGAVVQPPDSAQALLHLAAQRNRELTAPPAPALGLCLAGAGYGGGDATA